LNASFSFWIETMGCQMNLNDSELLVGILTQQGGIQVAQPEDADVAIVNTCAVRQKAEDKVYGMLGRLFGIRRKARENHTGQGLRIGVGGCVADKEKEALFRHKGVDFVFGTRALMNVPSLVQRALGGERKIMDFSDTLDQVTASVPRIRQGNSHAWVTIMYGCDKFCSYCIVPYTRHREKSRPMDDVLQEVRGLAEKGYREVTLLGQNVDSYGKDFPGGRPSFAELLREVGKVDGLERIWFLTSYPSDFSLDIVDVMAANPRFAPQIHLPVQAGSDRILKAMNRRYTRSEYLDLVDGIRSRLPDVSLSSDVIVGFPGESAEDFEQTVALVRQVRYERLNLAMYSVRLGTVAAKTMRDDVAPGEKNRRLQVLLALQKQINRELNEQYLGKRVQVIGESFLQRDPTLMYGRTGHNKIVIFPGKPEQLGNPVEVEIHRVTAGPLYGQVVELPVPEEC